jgi:hypothetical protein
MCILFLIFILFLSILYSRKRIETFETCVILVARYNEDLNWLKEEPFNKYEYVVYNKGHNEDYYKSDKFKYEIKLENVGREGHSYLKYIIDHYDKLDDFTFFLPGSTDSKNKLDRAKRMVNELKNNTDLFACILLDKSVNETFKDHIWSKYLATHENNKNLNSDDSMKPSDIQPYGKWFETRFNNRNIDSKCYTNNALFGVSKQTIHNKSKAYYEELIKDLEGHHNPETGHYFERSWETVFYPYTNMKYVY